MVNPIEVGRRLTTLRKKGLGYGELSRDQVAKEIGTSVSAVSMYENGERVPRDEIKVKIADFYGLSVQEIFYDEKCHIS